MSRWIAAMIALFACTPAMAGEGRRGRLGEMVERLGVDDATRARIQEIVDASRSEGKELRRDVKAAKRALRTLLDAPNPDEEEVMASIDIVASAKAAMKKHRMRTLLKVRSLLTPPQVERLKAMHRERTRKHRKHRRDPGVEEGGGFGEGGW